MKDYLERIDNPLMEYYRTAYRDSKRWDGKENLEGKRVVVYMEQGFGDQIMFARFVRLLKELSPAKVWLHAPKPLRRLFETLGVEVIEKDNACETVLPDHDLHVLSLSLPFLLNRPIPLEPYLAVSESEELPPGKFNVGVAWEGSMEHPHKSQRDCPLRHFEVLQRPGVQLYMVQPPTNWWNPDLIEDACMIDLKAADIDDFYDTARLMNSLDLVVSVDTAVLHLAGAMGKRAYGLLSETNACPRWDAGMWYPTVKLLRGPWERSLRSVDIG